MPIFNSCDYVDIRVDDLTGQKTQDLLALHLGGMHANSPQGQHSPMRLRYLLLIGVVDVATTFH